MSTNEPQVNTVVESSSTQTPVILRDNKNYTVLLSDLQRFVDPINQLLKPEKQLNKVNSINDLTQALTKENLRLKDKTIELNPILNEINSIMVDFNDEPEEEKAKYLGYNSIIVKTKPLENKIIPILTPQMLTQNNSGYVIEKSSDDFCGMAQVEIQDIALASNLEYTITPADLTNYTDGAYTLNFKFAGNRSSENIPFENFSDDVRELYTDSEGNSTVFGAKDLTINVPLVEYHEFTVDAKTLDKTFTPADVQPSLDGTGGSAGKIGFKQIKVSATLKSTLTADKLIADAKSGGGKKDSVGSDKVESENDVQGLGIGYPAVEIPPITTASIPIEPYIVYGPSYFSLDSTNSWENLNNFIGSGIESPYAIDSVNLNYNNNVIQQLTEDSNLFSSGEFNIRDVYSSGLSIVYNVHPYFGDISGCYYSWDNTNSTNVFFNSSVLSSTIKNVTTGFNLIDNITLPCAPVLNLRVNYKNFQEWRNATNTEGTTVTFADYLTTNYCALSETTGDALLDYLTIKLSKSSNYISFYSGANFTELDVTSSKATVIYSDGYSSSTIEQGDNPFEEYKVRLEQSIDSDDELLVIAYVSSSDSAITIDNIKHRKLVINLPPAFPDTKHKSFKASILKDKSEEPLKNTLFFISGYSSNVNVYIGEENDEFKIEWTKLGTDSNNENTPYLWSILDSDKKALAVCMYGDISKTSFVHKPCFFYITTADEPALPNSASS